MIGKSILLVSLALAFSGYSNATPRDEFSIDFERCRDDKFPTNQVLDRFTGIFFGDFITYDSLASLGPLAVEGDFSAPNYVVNANHGAICSRTRSFPSYALVVGGNVDTQNTMAYGSAYINGTGTLDQIVIEEKGCSVFDNKKTGVFSFPSVKEDLLLANQLLAEHEPTAFLLRTGTLTPFRDRQMDNYEILTFHTCGQTTCSIFPKLESQPDGMFLGQGDWKGPNSPTNRAKTYVYNIPVANGGSVTLDTTNPSAGLNICKTLFNIYPVDENGQFVPDGEFTLNRKTGGQLEGFINAPLGNIIDGSVGNFAGNVVGKSYTWEKPSDGVELHDMKAGGGSCEAYDGCMPFFLPPGVSKTTSRKTTTTKATTKTTSKGTTTTTEDVDVETLTDTLTVTKLQPATTTVTDTATLLSQDTATTTLVQQVGAVTNTVTLIQDGVTVTLESDPKTVEIVIDHPPSTITESGQTVVIPGQNSTITREPEERLTTEVYTTTITESGSTFVSLVTTTRVLPGNGGGVVTLIEPSNSVETIISSVAPVTVAPVTVTETFIEWHPRKHYHQGSDEPCYQDDEEEEQEEDEVYYDEDCDDDDEELKERYHNN
ncbi:hypothetical protein MBANPS3_010788 [Mucor bainieri]